MIGAIDEISRSIKYNIPITAINNTKINAFADQGSAFKPSNNYLKF